MTSYWQAWTERYQLALSEHPWLLHEAKQTDRKARRPSARRKGKSGGKAEK